MRHFLKTPEKLKDETSISSYHPRQNLMIVKDFHKMVWHIPRSLANTSSHAHGDAGNLVMLSYITVGMS